jgi:hypothetical protein
VENIIRKTVNKYHWLYALVLLPIDILGGITEGKHIMESKILIAIFSLITGAILIKSIESIINTIIYRTKKFKIIYPDGSIGYNLIREIPKRFNGKVEIIEMTKAEKQHVEDKEWFNKAQAEERQKNNPK